MKRHRVESEVGSRLRKIVSGGQTGVDRLAFDVAASAGLEVGGWAPHRWKAEDGEIPAAYRRCMEEHSGSYAERTKANVHDSDATLVFVDGPEFGKGSALATKLCVELEKPYMYLHVVVVRQPKDYDDFVEDARRMINTDGIAVLNIAGNRGSRCRPEFLDVVRSILEKIFAS